MKVSKELIEATFRVYIPQLKVLEVLFFSEKDFGIDMLKHVSFFQ